MTPPFIIHLVKLAAAEIAQHLVLLVISRAGIEQLDIVMEMARGDKEIPVPVVGHSFVVSCQ